jgi:hypothetical protein
MSNYLKWLREDGNTHMSKPYFLCAFNHAKGAKKFFNSMRKHLDGKVRPICLMYEPHGDIKLPKDSILIKYPKLYTGNTGRLKNFHDILPKLKLDKDAWIFFSDVHDVEFQCPLPDLPDDVDILVSNEQKTFGEIDFWVQWFPKRIHDWQAYNTGSMAMRYEPFIEFLSEINIAWNDFMTWYNMKWEGSDNLKAGSDFPFEAPMIHRMMKGVIGETFNSYADTFVFNTFLRNEKYICYDLPGLFTTYAFNYEMGTIKREDGKTYTSDGKLISIVHYNGKTKEYRKS